MKIFFTSDTHWNHQNIVRGCSKWEDKWGCRDFNTLEEHNKTIIDSINKYVKHDDILYHLGDWSFAGHENIKKFRDQLNVQTIHLCRGNHDEHISKYSECFTSIQDVLTIKHGQHMFFLSHYSHRIWLGSHKSVIHLYGHSHSTIDNVPYGKSMDVGIDNSFKLNNEYRPFSIEEIISIMGKRSVKFVDGHNSKTNI